MKSVIMGIALAAVLTAPMGSYANEPELEKEKQRADLIIEASLDQALENAKIQGKELPLKIGKPTDFPRLHTRVAKDAFAGLAECAIVDKKLPKSLDLKSAILLLEPCMGAVSGKYRVPVSAEEAVIGEIQKGILIKAWLTPYGSRMWTLEEDWVFEDLNSSLGVRRGKLLGYPARVRSIRRSSIGPENHGRKTSSLQEVFGKCSVHKLEIFRVVKNARDFLAHYESCFLEEAPGKQIVAVLLEDGSPAENAIRVISQADDATVQDMNGLISLTGDKGNRVTIKVKAERVPACP